MSMIERGNHHVGGFRSRLFFSRVVQFLALLTVTTPGAVQAQTIAIKLVNGKDGHPMANKCINVGADHLDHMLAIPTDVDGVARLGLTTRDAEISINWRPCGDWGVSNPIVKYSETISINAGYALCRPHTQDYSWLARMAFSTKKVLEQGVVTPNNCGKATATQTPGELVVFVRPLTWWERLKQ